VEILCRRLHSSLAGIKCRFDSLFARCRFSLSVGYQLTPGRPVRKLFGTKQFERLVLQTWLLSSTDLERAIPVVFQTGILSQAILSASLSSRPIVEPVQIGTPPSADGGKCGAGFQTRAVARNGIGLVVAFRGAVTTPSRRAHKHFSSRQMAVSSAPKHQLEAGTALPTLGPSARVQGLVLDDSSALRSHQRGSAAGVPRSTAETILTSPYAYAVRILQACETGRCWRRHSRNTRAGGSLSNWLHRAAWPESGESGPVLLLMGSGTFFCPAVPRSLPISVFYVRN